MHTFTKPTLKSIAVLLLIAALFASGINQLSAQAAPLTSTACTGAGTGTATCNLWAKAATIAFPGPSTSINVNVWGYTDSAAGALVAPGGPTLIVNQGDTVTVNLTNNLSEATALFFQGQAMIPDTTGIGAGGTTSYTFTAANPGTYLYEAGLLENGQHQVAMGLYGALIVRPATANQAYGAGSDYNDEALILLSEIDTTLNNSANPATFDMRNYHPRYWLINGKVFPNTDLINTTSGNTVLLRYVNAGIQPHSMSLLGLSQSVIAIDGSPLQFARNYVAETLAPGQTLDALATVPASTPNGSRFALYEASFIQHNNNAAGFGGMLTFIQAGSGSIIVTDTTGPATSSVSLSPNPTNGSVNVALSASISDAASGGANITAAEYFIDTSGANGTGSALSGSFGSPTVSVNATISTAQLASLASGSHTVYIHGQDSLGNWGAFNLATLNLDKTGPTTSAVTLSPAASNGTANVSLTATGSDSASGNNNVTAAEYAVDGGTAVAMTVNSPAPVAALSATIPAATVNALSNGTHTVSVRSRDALGNWGAPVSANLFVDKTGPTVNTGSLSASPNPSNGLLGYNSSVSAIRVFAGFTDTTSNLAAAEAFIDTVGANGSGVLFVANDGVFNSLGESGYADLPLSQLTQLSSGNHTIYAHAKDAAGNWGATTSIVFLIDRSAPTLTSISLSPASFVQSAVSTVTLTMNGASDTGGSNLVGGEYWINPPTSTAPAPGGGTQFTGTTANIPVGSLVVGSYTISARVRDGANNWSSIQTATLTISVNTIFANGFETGTAPWGWTSRSTNTTSRLNVTTGAALVGTRGLQAQGNNTNYVQYNFGTTANPASSTFDARFYFRPNANSSTGKDIFQAATASNFNTILFRVRYRLNGTTPQAQIQLGNTANATWTNLVGGTSNNYLEVVWTSGGSLQLYVNGVLSQTLTGGTGSVAAFRLGSVTSTGASTTMYFDAFSAKRLTSPLVGP